MKRSPASWGGWVSAAAVILFLSAWELFCRLELVNPVLLVSPTRIAITGTELLASGALSNDILFTVEVFLLSLGVAVVAGVTVGFAMGTSWLAYHAINPFVVVANSLPKIVLIPLIVLWLGIGMAANTFLGALMAGFPIITSTYAGTRSLDRDFILLARSYRASRWLTLRAIVLPGMTPFVLSGLRIAISYAMVGSLIAEFFASSQGIGYRMVLYMSNFQVEAFFVCMILVAIFTLVCTSAVHRLERIFDAWRPNAFDGPRLEA